MSTRFVEQVEEEEEVVSVGVTFRLTPFASVFN